MIWTDIGGSLLIICLETLPYAFAGQRPLQGIFTWHTALGGTLALLLSIFHFGIYKWMKNRKIVIWGLFLLVIAFIFIILTESRGLLLGCFTSACVLLGGIALKHN